MAILKLYEIYWKQFIHEAAHMFLIPCQRFYCEAGLEPLVLVSILAELWDARHSKTMVHCNLAIFNFGFGHKIELIEYIIKHKIVHSCKNKYCK